jgi:hypothetical protein
MRADIATERERTRVEREALEHVAVGLDRADPELGWSRLVADWGLQYFASMIEQLDALAGALDRLVAGPAD